MASTSFSSLFPRHLLTQPSNGQFVSTAVGLPTGGKPEYHSQKGRCYPGAVLRVTRPGCCDNAIVGSARSVAATDNGAAYVDEKKVKVAALFRGISNGESLVQDPTDEAMAVWLVHPESDDPVGIELVGVVSKRAPFVSFVCVESTKPCPFFYATRCKESFTSAFHVSFSNLSVYYISRFCFAGIPTATAGSCSLASSSSPSAEETDGAQSPTLSTCSGLATGPGRVLSFLTTRRQKTFRKR